MASARVGLWTTLKSYSKWEWVGQSCELTKVEVVR